MANNTRNLLKTHDASLPDWLSCGEVMSLSTDEVLDIQYDSIFERILDKISSGITLKECLNDDVRKIEHAAFMKWINKNAKRKERYYEAQEVGSEMVASEIIDIADAKDNPFEDIQRSKLRIESRKFLLSVWNRKRFGEVKQVEIGGSISVIDALNAANQRLVGNVIEGELVEIDAEERDAEE